MISNLITPWLTANKRVQPGVFEIRLDSFPHPLSYHVKVHKRRKNAAMEIHNGTVVVKVPPHCNQAMVETFMSQQQHWLKQRLSHSATSSVFKRIYESGEPIWFFGQKLRLEIIRDSKTGWCLTQDPEVLTVSVSHRVKDVTKHVRAQLHAFYMNNALSYIPERVRQLECRLGLSSTSLDFKFYQWRWGCCYSSGKIIFNPLLLSAPKEQIDCVIIHELCHLKHMNHSKAFWSLNKKYCNECGNTKKWLKQYHNEIYFPPT